MLYTALVTDKGTKEQTIITSDYACLKAFQSDLKANGYSIVYASTAGHFDKGMRNFWAAKEYMNKETHIFVYGK